MVKRVAREAALRFLYDLRRRLLRRDRLRGLGAVGERVLFAVEGFVDSLEVAEAHCFAGYDEMARDLELLARRLEEVRAQVEGDDRSWN